jgi:hypothetical protein
MPTFELSYDKAIADELRKRFASNIAVLENDGFIPFGLHQEIIYPFSVLIFFPVYLAMLLGGEVIRIQSPLRITSFHLMYASHDFATYAYLYGLGTKFYTNFTDGTWLVSNTALNTRNGKVIVLKSDPELAHTRPIWERHRMKVLALEAEGRSLYQHLSFDHWAGVERQFDQGSLPSVIGMGLAWLAVVIGALYWLIGRLFILLSSN